MNLKSHPNSKNRPIWSHWTCHNFEPKVGTGEQSNGAKNKTCFQVKADE